MFLRPIFDLLDTTRIFTCAGASYVSVSMRSGDGHAALSHPEEQIKPSCLADIEPIFWVLFSFSALSQVLSRRCCVTLRSSCAGTPALHPVCTSRFRAESTSLAMSARSRTDRECAVYCLRTRPSATSTPNPRGLGDAVATAHCRAKSKPGVNLCGFVVGLYRTDQSANEISEYITSRGRPGPNIT